MYNNSWYLVVGGIQDLSINVFIWNITGILSWIGYLELIQDRVSSEVTTENNYAS